MSANVATKEAIWLQNVVHFISKAFGSDTKPPVKLYMDNMAAIKVARNPEFYSKSKNIDIGYHFIRQRVELGQIVLQHIPTNDMIADYLTKALSSPKHILCRERSGITQA